MFKPTEVGVNKERSKTSGNAICPYTDKLRLEGIETRTRDMKCRQEREITRLLPIV